MDFENIGTSAFAMNFGSSFKSSNNLDAELIYLIRKNQHIQAIKICREKTGKSLKEAKEYVDELKYGKSKNDELSKVKIDNAVDVSKINIIDYSKLGE